MTEGMGGAACGVDSEGTPLSKNLKEAGELLGIGGTLTQKQHGGPAAGAAALWGRDGSSNRLGVRVWRAGVDSLCGLHMSLKDIAFILRGLRSQWRVLSRGLTAGRWF